MQFKCNREGNMRKKKLLLSVCPPLLLSLSVLGTGFVLGANDGETPAIDSSSSAGEEENKEPIKATIADIYENTRPNYGEMFDYDSEYVPADPPDVNKDITLTLDSRSPVKFKGGSNTLVKKPTETLSESDFDMSSITGGRKLAGIATVTEGVIGTGVGIDTYAVPFENTTILPYFSAAEGFTTIDIASGKNGYGLNDDGTTIKASRGHVTPNTVILGGTNGYPAIGATVKLDGTVYAGDTFRLDSKAAGVNVEGDNNTYYVYEFNYNFQNLGTSRLYLEYYQISTSADYKNSSTAYEDHYRIDVILEPGETLSTMGQYKLRDNNNFLSYIVVDRDTEDFNMGLSIEAKKTTLDEPTTISPEKPVEYGEINVNLPEGITLKDDTYGQAVVGEPIVPPTDAQLTNTTGRTVEGWYVEERYDSTGHQLRTTDMNMPEGSITIAPYFAPVEGQQLVIGSARSEYHADYYYNLDEMPDELDPSSDDEAKQYFKDKNTIISRRHFINNEMGALVTKSSDLAVNDFFRFLTACGEGGTNQGFTTGQTYRMTYNLVNYGSETLKFHIVQIPSTVLITEEEGAVVSESITLAPNETKQVVLDNFAPTSNNANSMTGFIVESAVKSLNLGITMNKVNLGAPIVTTATLVDSPINFTNGTKTISKGSGETLSAADFDTSKLADGRTLLGVAEVTADGYANRTSLENGGTYTLTGNTVSLIPYFSAASGMTILTDKGANHGFNLDGVPGTLNDDLYGTTEEAYSATSFSNNNVVSAGENGYAQLGFDAGISKKITAGDGMRWDFKTAGVNDGEAVYEFNYIFENKGDNALHLDLYQISASNEMKNGSTEYQNRYRIDVDLEPGESMTAMGQYKLGSNGNFLTFAIADQDMNSMSIGMSISVKKTDLSEPTTVSEPEDDEPVEPDPTEKLVKFNLPDGITVKDTYTPGAAGTKLVVPTADQIENTTGRTIEGWFIDDANANLVTSSTTIPTGGVTIAPYFAPITDHNKLWLCSGSWNGQPNDTNYSGVSTGSFTAIPHSTDGVTNASSQKIVRGKDGFAELGVDLKYNGGTINAGSYFRCDSTFLPSAMKAGTHEFSLNFENKGTAEIDFTIYLINSGHDKNSATNNSFVLKLAPGEATTISVSPTYAKGNDNCLLLFEANSACSDFNLGVAMSVKHGA